MSSGQARYYVELAREDYYLEGGEPPGTWFGEGAARLGLQGQVQKDQLYHLFDGLSPEGDRALVKFQGKAGQAKHHPGWDLTFSAPKTLSILWSQASPETRDRISELHKEAVHTALAYLEERYGAIRVGHGGKHSTKAGLVFALFEHGTSRALDPLLHGHALLLNAAVDADGRSGTVNSYRFFRAKLAAGALYRAALGSLVTNELGIRVEPARIGWDVVGVPKEFASAMSKRGATIANEMARIGAKGSKAAARVAVETREKKREVSRENLFDGVWRNDGMLYGFGRSDAEGLLGQHRPAKSLKAEIAQATTRAIEKLGDDRSHFTEAQFERAFFEAAQTSGIPPRTLLEHTSRHLATSPDIVRLGVSDRQIRYTTVESFKVEERLLENAERLSQRTKHSVPASSVVEGLAKQDRLNAEQMRAVLHVVHQTGDLALVSGVAGAGKSTLLAAAKEEWEKAGYRVIGTAVNGTAAQNLEKRAGIRSDTLSKLLFDLEAYGSQIEARRKIAAMASLHGPSVFEPAARLVERFCPNIMQIIEPIVDKCGPNVLAPLDKLSEKWAPDALHTIRELNKHHGPNVLQAFHSLAHYLTENFPVIGKPTAPLDRRTVVVVDESGCLGTEQGDKLLAACWDHGAKAVLVGGRGQLPAIGKGGVFEELIERHPGAALTENRRQTKPWMRDASKDIHEGHPKAALKDFAERGALVIDDTKEQAKERLIDRWAADASPLESRIIMTGTRDEAADLNRMAQGRRLEAKEIRGEPLPHAGGSLYEGDLVAFGAPARKLGVRNRERGTIESIDHRREQVLLQMESGAKVRVNLNDYPALFLGYASTTNAAQGGTYASGHILYEHSMQSKEFSYVQVSRLTENVAIYASRAEVGDDLEAMRKRMARSEEKEMAHAVPRARERDMPISR